MTTLLKILEINVNKGSTKDQTDVSDLQTIESSKPVKVAKLVGTTLTIGAGVTGLYLLSRIVKSVFRSLFHSNKSDLAS